MRAAHVGAVGETVRRARLEAARRVVEVAQEQDAQFIVVAGDTFEDNAVDRLLVQKVADILGAFAGPVYLIAGNHDALVPGSVWEHPAWKSHRNLQVLTTAAAVDIEGAFLARFARSTH
jgi:metallophosphoesterase superfamily enzyme